MSNLSDEIRTLENEHPVNQIVRVPSLGNMTWLGIVELSKCRASLAPDHEDLSTWEERYASYLRHFVKTVSTERE